MKNEKQKNNEQANNPRQNSRFEIVGQKGNRFDIIRWDGKKTVMTVPPREEDE